MKSNKSQHEIKHRQAVNIIKNLQNKQAPTNVILFDTKIIFPINENTSLMARPSVTVGQRGILHVTLKWYSVNNVKEHTTVNPYDSEV